MNSIAIAIASTLAVTGLAAAVVADAGPVEFVNCTIGQVEKILDGVTPMPCVLEPTAESAAGPDLQRTVDCVKYAVSGIVGGHFQPCRPF